MRKLASYQPHGVFRFFEDICNIPHGSGHTKKIADYLVDFAVSYGFDYTRDKYNNVVIVKEATDGYDSFDTLMLQAHTDMVCVSSDDISINFDEEAIKLICDGDEIHADGSSLGADDGIGVALILAVLESDNIDHPRIEAVFTSDEEIGMIGAERLDVSGLKATRMINIDSDKDGVYTVACAGGNVTKCSFPILHIPHKNDGDCFVKLSVSGLCGGHSGIEIDKGRANANVLMGRILYELNRTDKIHLVDLNGGEKDNAIPVQCEAVVCVSDFSVVQNISELIENVFRSEYHSTEPELKVSCELLEESLFIVDDISTQNIIHFMLCVPDGVQNMNYDIPGLVQTSLNLGCVRTNKDSIDFSFCVRSCVDSNKKHLTDILTCLAEKMGGSSCVYGDYPAWQYNSDSIIQNTVSVSFEKLYGYKPTFEIIHAGLECGIFSSKISNLDCVSLGCRMDNIHTPCEVLYASSVERLWNLLVSVLKNIY